MCVWETFIKVRSDSHPPTWTYLNLRFNKLVFFAKLDFNKTKICHCFPPKSLFDGCLLQIEIPCIWYFIRHYSFHLRCVGRMVWDKINTTTTPPKYQPFYTILMWWCHYWPHYKYAHNFHHKHVHTDRYVQVGCPAIISPHSTLFTTTVRVQTW